MSSAYRSRRKAPAAAAAPRKASKAPATKSAGVAKAAGSKAAPAKAEAANLPPLLSLVQVALEDMKAVDVRVLNVVGLTDIADFMVVASGNSDRHVKSIADRVVQQVKSSGTRPYGIEGEQDGEWVLVDLPDIMVHVMLPRVREFYSLEQLWDNAPKLVVPVDGAAAPKRRPRKASSTDKRGGRPGGAGRGGRFAAAKGGPRGKSPGKSSSRAPSKPRR